MAVCARAVQQADSTLVLALDPTAADLSACPYVVQSGAELGDTLLTMSAQDGALASGMIVSVWLAAYFTRVVIDIFKVRSPE